MKKVLVIIDMQNDFTKGVLGNKECEAAIASVVHVLKSDNWDKIFLTRDTHGDNYLDTQEGKRLPVKHCIKNTDGWEIVPEIMDLCRNKYSQQISIIDKPTFGSLELSQELKKYQDLDVNDSEMEIYFCGVCTGICVINNVILAKATLPEARICVFENACACVTQKSHKTAIEAMRNCQIDII